jgi:Putative peptidoglycan binding domain/Transglycosylase SLT domain
MRFKEFKPFYEDNKPSGMVLTEPNGRVGPEVADIQKALLALGIATSDDLGNLGRNKDGVDGIRGPLTSAAIKKFQTQAGIRVDGDPGPETVGALNKTLADHPEIKFTKSTEDDVSPIARSGARSANYDVSVIQDPDFNKKLELVAKDLGVNSKDLLTIMKFESGLKTGYQNWPKHKAVGLIQFMPDTARDLGTSTDQLAHMTAVEQLDFVWKFYKMNNLRPGSDIGTIYMKTFLPSYAYDDDSTVVAKKDNRDILPKSGGLTYGSIYGENPGFARGKDYYTVGDVKKFIQSKA